MLKPLLLFTILLLPFICNSQQVKLESKQKLTNASYRSISIVNDSVIWVGGSKGTVCMSADGGNNFNCKTVFGYDSTEFRSIFAFSEKEAVIGNIGSPARVLRTNDGGASWDVVYENDSKEAFIDGIDFWDDNEGICFGDPIRNTMMLLRTSDGGKTWKQVHVSSRPLLVDDEAAFAASNSAMRCYPNGRVVIATGGTLSRLLVSDDFGITWSNFLPPILQGKPSTGIFSFDFYDKKNAIIVGGDYKIDSLQLDHVFYTSDSCKTWQAPARPTRGYRECVTYLTSEMMIAVGPTGVDISNDGGKNWDALSDETGFHVVKKSRNGQLIMLVGANGRAGFLKLNK